MFDTITDDAFPKFGNSAMLRKKSRLSVGEARLA